MSESVERGPSRLARLEQLNRLATAPQRLRIQYSFLKTLPTITADHGTLSP